MIVKVAEQINLLGEKWRLWSNCVEKGSFANFPELTQILADNDAENDLSSMLIIDIKGHLKSLFDNLDGYFLNLSVEPWIVDPFTISFDHTNDENKLKDDLIELKFSGCLKMQFSTAASPSEFWASNYMTFPNLAAKVLRVTLSFITTYLCEAGFSTLVVMETKLQARLDVDSDMRVAISKTAPRIKHLVENKQEHLSPCVIVSLSVIDDQCMTEFVILRFPQFPSDCLFIFIFSLQYYTMLL